MKHPYELARTTADVALPTWRLTRRVRDLETGVEENAALEVLLTAQVDRLEQGLVPVLEAALARSGGRRDAD